MQYEKSKKLLKKISIIKTKHGDRIIIQIIPAPCFLVLFS